MIGGSAGRGQRIVWAILSLLFVVSFAVSTFVVRSERNEALDDVVQRARDQAHLVADTLTGRQLTEPVTGSNYDDLANKIWKSISSKGSIVGLTVWSARGRILFSLNESRVGKAPSEMQSLITRTATGSVSTRMVDDTVQTFTKISKPPGGPVGVVEVDQPLAIVDAEIGDLWSTLRVGSVFGMAVSLVLLGLTFVSWKRRARAPQSDERPRQEAGADVSVERQEGGADVGVERQRQEGGADVGVERRRPAAAPTDRRQPTYAEIFGTQVQQDEVPDQVELDGDLERRAPMQKPREEVHAMALEPDLKNEPKQSMQNSQQSVQKPREEALDPALENDPRIQAIRQRREAFKARAEQAQLRLMQAENELHETSSGRKSE